ncbi:unnamed protein product [Paramecium sonneborni]|uniref:Uncharacterized protein n=1 Tax=Paramecium sonneborni TaxID=65129 RepID=A0A8S1Q9N4_9CILI|nr:unnamed protein product [Paramecium sonneborni]
MDIIITIIYAKNLAQNVSKIFVKSFKVNGIEKIKNKLENEIIYEYTDSINVKIFWLQVKNNVMMEINKIMMAARIVDFLRIGCLSCDCKNICLAGIFMEMFQQQLIFMALHK